MSGEVRSQGSLILNYSRKSRQISIRRIVHSRNKSWFWNSSD